MTMTTEEQGIYNEALSILRAVQKADEEGEIELPDDLGGRIDTLIGNVGEDEAEDEDEDEDEEDYDEDEDYDEELDDEE